jgi:hypothetical protein
MSESDMHVSAGSIFICYRREDSADVTGRVYDRLIDHFGPERVFMDVEAIRLGYDFRSEIDRTIKVCSIVIVVIAADPAISFPRIVTSANQLLRLHKGYGRAGNRRARYA